jgi:hypothetical protein
MCHPCSKHRNVSSVCVFLRVVTPDFVSARLPSNMNDHVVPSSIGLTCQGPVSCNHALVSPWWHASTGSAGCHAEAGRLGHGLCEAPPPGRLEQPHLGQPLFLGQPLLERLRQHGVAVVSGLTQLLCIYALRIVVMHHHSPLVGVVCCGVLVCKMCLGKSRSLSQHGCTRDSSAWTGIGCTLSVGRNC